MHMHVQKLKLQKNCSLGYLHVVCDGKQKLQAEKEVRFCHQQKDRQKKKNEAKFIIKSGIGLFQLLLCVLVICPGTK